MITRACIIETARAEVENETPWIHQATRLGVGLDCIGLIAATAAACGSADGARFLGNPANSQYGPTSLPAKLYAACREFMEPIATADAMPADVYLMCFAKEPQHFGFASLLMVDGVLVPSLIHTWAARGKVVEHHIDRKWGRRIMGAWRLRGIV